MPEINAGDTAWVLTSTALVMLMTPGLALFYGGLVRRKNVLSTIMHSFFILGLVSVTWVLWGYTLAFGPDTGLGLIGGLDWLALEGVTGAPSEVYATTTPHLAFMAFQMMFAIITPALISGAFAEPVLGVHGWTSNPARRKLEVAPVQQHCHRVEIPSLRLETQPIRFKRNGAATSKGIEDGRQVPVTVLQHLVLRFRVDLRMLVELLPHHPPDDREQPFTLGILCGLLRPFLRMRFRVVDHRGEEHSTSRRQRETRPPMVDAFGVRTDPRHLVVGRCIVDLWQRQRHFDELLLLGLHRGASARASSSPRS